MGGGRNAQVSLLTIGVLNGLPARAQIRTSRGEVSLAAGHNSSMGGSTAPLFFRVKKEVVNMTKAVLLPAFKLYLAFD